MTRPHQVYTVQNNDDDKNKKHNSAPQLPGFQRFSVDNVPEMKAGLWSKKYDVEKAYGSGGTPEEVGERLGKWGTSGKMGNASAIVNWYFAFTLLHQQKYVEKSQGAAFSAFPTHHSTGRQRGCHSRDT